LKTQTNISNAANSFTKGDRLFLGEYKDNTDLKSKRAGHPWPYRTQKHSGKILFLSYFTHMLQDKVKVIAKRHNIDALS